MRCEGSKKPVATTEVQIKEGIPHEVILEEAAIWRADLIVMGILGRRGIAHILLGSVAERLIECSEIPVLVVQ
jgi:nucleotide-binding universal stress UspA family protein